MMKRGPFLAGLVAWACAAPALAVGLSPLHKEGLTASPSKAFYLTIINPYSTRREYRAYVSGTPEEAQGVKILPERLHIAPGGQRRITVIITDLEPGTTRETHVCAELAQFEGMINARVCSTLLARRIAARD